MADVESHGNQWNFICGSSVCPQNHLSEKKPHFHKIYNDQYSSTCIFARNTRQNQDRQSDLAISFVTQNVFCKGTALEFCIKSCARCPMECSVLLALRGHIQ